MTTKNNDDLFSSGLDIAAEALEAQWPSTAWHQQQNLHLNEQRNEQDLQKIDCNILGTPKSQHQDERKQLNTSLQHSSEDFDTCEELKHQSLSDSRPEL